jgi:hypothetical protein
MVLRTCHSEHFDQAQCRLREESLGTLLARHGFRDPSVPKKANDVLAEAALFDCSPESIGLPLRELSFLLFEQRFCGVDALGMTAPGGIPLEACGNDTDGRRCDVHSAHFLHTG